jgi:hypothetical protein
MGRPCFARGKTRGQVLLERIEGPAQVSCMGFMFYRSSSVLLASWKIAWKRKSVSILMLFTVAWSRVLFLRNEGLASPARFNGMGAFSGTSRTILIA